MSTEKSIAGLFIAVLERLTTHVSDLTYNGKKIGLDIFIVNFIGDRTAGTEVQKVNMKDIIANLNIRPSTATRKIDDLVSIGLVSRVIPENNRREITLGLTEEGVNLYTAFRQLLESSISGLLQEFSTEEIATFEKILGTIARATDQLVSDLSL